jgi:hypothetical protein
MWIAAMTEKSWLTSFVIAPKYGKFGLIESMPNKKKK